MEIHTFDYKIFWLIHRTKMVLSAGIFILDVFINTNLFNSQIADEFATLK